jgi:maltose alpha-D-glucosyltransferase/alpha-amylase
VIKVMRAVLDAEYTGKVFLAEANQWPEDVRQYFGDGDECHMAFHFPLMPRMFMAIAEEDRYPIVDIMRQTPEIPDGCQWAIFLRNHDEMTLEMVTERERDNMYRIYATEPRARINVGIRRRLAPLMENDRRRIELLIGLLMSMPGTPIVYYGDEIGMGDNIYLSDRDGVRTPMQWSIDRNGGFSRADPARLFLPPIMDSVYGFQSVNVESQGRSPSSLLNWLRRLIAVRQGYKAFGRGTLTFLTPANRKVIAYLREYGNEKILCVANLARNAQQVALDLSDFRGRVPVEMIGWSPFQTIGADRYTITLPGHGFFWFLLSEDAQAPAWGSDLPGELPELLTLVLPREPVGSQLGGKALALFEKDVLAAYLPKQRWFAAGGGLGTVRISDTVRLDGDGIIAYLTMIEATQRDGSQAAYFVPLAIANEGRDERSPALARATLARTRRGPLPGFLYDAFAIDAFVVALLDELRAGRTLEASRGGTYSFEATPALQALPASERPKIRRMDVEQSNTSVVIDERIVLKGYRRIAAGAQPELEIARFLDGVGYAATPQLYGFAEYRAPDGSTTALCIAQEFVENQGDGWATTLAYLERFFDRQKSLDVPEGDYHEIFMQRARRLGMRTAELHRAFATTTGDAAFDPEPATAADFEAWTQQARASAERALDTLERDLENVPADMRDFAAELVADRQAVYERLQLPDGTGQGVAKTRYHGDFHLGQVLVVADDFRIVDFEGEPARALADRRRKSLPLRDVAGMLRSINYAAVAAMRGATTERAEDTSALEPLARAWEARSVEAFLTGYRETIAGVPSYPRDEAAANRLLELFVLEKAFYEMSYELANRPSWVRIPLEGIRSILGSSPTPETAVVS